MWWGITAALAVTWLFGLTHATLEMWMEPEDKNVYYVKEGGPKFIQCIVKVDKGVKVNLTWSGPSIDASRPQRVSHIPHGDYDMMGNWLNITHFSNTTAGYYKCRALTSASQPNDLTQTIKLDKECDSERFNPPDCDKNCSTYCNPGPDGAKGRNCDHMNGTCLSGCQEGYKMPYCTEKVDDPGDKDIGGIIGGVIGGGIGLLVVLIIIVLCVRRVRKRRKADAATPANVRQRQKEEEMVLIAEEKTDDKIEKPKADNDKREIESQITYFVKLSRQSDRDKQQLEDLLNQRDEMKRKIEDLEKIEKKLQEEKAKLEGDKRFLEGRLQELPTKESVEKLQQEKEELKGDKGFLEGRLQEKERAEKERAEKERAEKERAEKEREEKERAEKERADIQAQLATMQNRLTEKETELQEVTSKKNTLQEQEAKLNAQIEELQRSIKAHEELQQLIQMQDAEINTLKDEIKQREESAGKKIESLKQQMEQKDKEHQAEIEGLKTQIDHLTKENEILQKRKQEQDAQVKQLKKNIHQMKEEKNKADDDIDLSKTETVPGAQMLQAKIPPSIGLQAQTLCTLKAGIWTTIKEYDPPAIDYGGHFDRDTGCFTVPREGSYQVTFSTDEEKGHLFLHHIRDSDKSDTSICDNRESQFDKGLDLCERTLNCSLCENDCLYLKGVSGRTCDIDVTVRFSVSYLG